MRERERQRKGERERERKRAGERERENYISFDIALNKLNFDLFFV